MNNVLPPKLRGLIEKSAYAGGVRQTFDYFVSLLGNTNTGLYFFPEYTDHGPQHIAGVLASAAALIPNKVWKLLTPDDGVLIALSALLHDIAMILPPDGLQSLIASKNVPRIARFDKKGWRALFDDFFAEARRWDDRRLLKVLGDKDNQSIAGLAKDIVHVNERTDSEDWSVRYRKFLGEFVRRHHARLAHEIACYNFPGGSKDPALKGISSELADIAGVVARSHNLNPRQTYEYLDHAYDGHVICRNTHPVFVMILLRISDYLQLDAKRANATWNSIHRLRSPISQEEWNAHLNIKEIRSDDADPQALFFSALPGSASNFLKIKKLLAGLQGELDLSWAVLAEVYGRITELRDLGITLRRVRSNLDNEDQFLKKHNPSYFPTYAVFDTAGASLLKLLIRPLYGDRPEVGIRELIQNSLDAVRELQKLVENHPELSKVRRLKQRPDVLVSISKQKNGNHYLTIADKGVGMSFETVRDYFLKAGVSFRQSDAWQREFMCDGKAKVLRSGRFGIGALSAFLLGDRLRVTTRSIWSKPEDGVIFDARVEDDSIELRREKVDHVGTTIEILLDEKAAGELIEDSDKSSYRSHSWDWYILEKPVVERRLFGRKLEQNLTIPTKFHPNWRSIFNPDYRGILWSYIGRYQYTDLLLACNGIRVRQTGESNDGYTWGPLVKQMPCKVPAVSVFDDRAALPLTLQRDRLETSFFPFAPELAEDVSKDFCAYLLAHAPTVPTTSEGSGFYPLERQNTWGAFPGVGPLVATSEGTMLLHPWHVQQSKLRRVFASSEKLHRSGILSQIATRTSGYSMSLLDPVLLMWELANKKLLHTISSKASPVIGIRLLVTNPEALKKANDDLDPQYDFRDLNVTRLESDLLFEGGHLGSSRTHMMEVWEEVTDWDDEATVSLEIFFDPSRNTAAASPFTAVWDQVMGKPVIPFDSGSRQRRFKSAYQELAEYLSLWTNPLEATWRHDFVERRTK